MKGREPSQVFLSLVYLITRHIGTTYYVLIRRELNQIDSVDVAPDYSRRLEWPH